MNMLSGGEQELFIYLSVSRVIKLNYFTARFLRDGRVVTVDPNGGLLDAVQPMDFLPGFHLEGYPNRDSTAYGELYGIREAHTLLRGTLRYSGTIKLAIYDSHLPYVFPGYTDILKGFVRLGLLSPEQHPALHQQALKTHNNPRAARG